jgi:putative lipoprotein
MKMARLTAAFALGFSTLALAACASTATPAGQPVTVSGSIAYRERIALPPSAQIEVRLDDVSLADAPARNIARQAFGADGQQVPIAFLLRFDRSAIEAKHSYAVSARITGDDGKLMFITDTRNSVTFDGASENDLGVLNLVKTN